ncbi:hypothetical protein NXF25_011193 [Crotalus adamanteus]|uniref:Uncharacterized protein n=1 Tax=Crotalus adamanteus TaxID=8729 RepID=A0AAW1BEX5_CROAD
MSSKFSVTMALHHPLLKTWFISNEVSCPVSISSGCELLYIQGTNPKPYDVIRTLLRKNPVQHLIGSKANEIHPGTVERDTEWENLQPKCFQHHGKNRDQSPKPNPSAKCE